MPDDRARGRASIGARRNPASEAAILAAAREVLAEGGAGAFSIDEVARRAGAGKPTIYRWWPNRAELLLAVHASDRAGRLEESRSGNLSTDLATFARTLFGVWREGPGGYALRALVAEAQSSEAALLALWDRVVPAWSRPIRAMLGEAARRGEIDPADTDLLVELYSGFLVRRLLLGQIDDDRTGIERMARLLASARGRR